MRRLRMAGGLALVLALAGCSGRDGADADGGSGIDGGSTPIDGGPGVDAGQEGDDGGGGGTDAGPPVACDAPIPALAYEPIAGDTVFDQPIFVAQPAGSSDLYVVEREGRIRIVRAGAVLPEPFLDISAQTGDYGFTGGDERGLLGLAFHPQYTTNGRFFVFFAPTDGRQANIVAEGSRSSVDPDRADASVETVIELTGDTRRNHNGGTIAFGPDGYLYVGTGDGGGGGDPDDNGQDLSTLYGKMLRIDVDGGTPYAVPSDNPFVGMAGVENEIWAYGLRNPFRFSFDRETGDLWIGDVGQDLWEEIDFQPASSSGGENYGWNAFEATHAFGGGGPLREGSTHVTPITEYSHDDGQSVVGGHVYRGSAIPGLRGAYLFADSYSDFVRAMRVCEGAITLAPQRVDGLSRPMGGGAALVSFGEDQSGELYLVYLGVGEVVRVIAAE